mmetsp:Transcript_4079/g.14996  ORF Transcript_4079/g.14996 Transcript_4079/m.14996 type:complete len:396 (+) Transcript_4079:831-2018(+)
MLWCDLPARRWSGAVSSTFLSLSSSSPAVSLAVSSSFGVSFFSRGGSAGFLRPVPSREIAKTLNLFSLSCSSNADALSWVHPLLSKHPIPDPVRPISAGEDRDARKRPSRCARAMATSSGDGRDAGTTISFSRTGATAVAFARGIVSVDIKALTAGSTGRVTVGATGPAMMAPGGTSTELLLFVSLRGNLGLDLGSLDAAMARTIAAAARDAAAAFTDGLGGMCTSTWDGTRMLRFATGNDPASVVTDPNTSCAEKGSSFARVGRCASGGHTLIPPKRDALAGSDSFGGARWANCGLTRNAVYARSFSFCRRASTRALFLAPDVSSFSSRLDATVDCGASNTCSVSPSPSRAMAPRHAGTVAWKFGPTRITQGLAPTAPPAPKRLTPIQLAPPAP